MGSRLRYHLPLQAVAAFPPPRISIGGNTGTIIVKDDLGDVGLGRAGRCVRPGAWVLRYKEILCSEK